MSTIIESLNGEISVVRIDGKLNKEQHRRLENESDLQVEISEWNNASSEYLLSILKKVSGLKISDQGLLPKILDGKIGHLKCLMLDYCVNATNIDFAQFTKLEKLVIGTNSINWDSLIKCQECIGIEFQEVGNYGNADVSLIKSLKKLSFESVKSGTFPKGICWDSLTHFNLHNYKGNDFIIPDINPRT